MIKRVLCLIPFFFCLFPAQAQLNGIYTVDPSQPATATNYRDFQSTLNDLQGTSRPDGGPSNGPGVSGPVVFNAAAVSFNEQLNILPVSGSSSVNSITYQGNGANLHFASVNSNARAVIKFNGARHFDFSGFTINAAGGVYGWGVHFTNSAEYNTVSYCTILTDSVFCDTLNLSHQSYYAGVVASPFSNTFASFPYNINGANHCTVSNCLISGGQTGIQIDGGAWGSLSTGMTLRDNSISGFYRNGISFNHTDSLRISGNRISRKFRTNAPGIVSGIFSAYSNYNFIFEKNTICDFFNNVSSWQTTGVSSANIHGIFLRLLDQQRPMNGIIRNNLIYNLGDDGVRPGKIRAMHLEYSNFINGSSPQDFLHVINNTIYLDNPLPTPKPTTGIYLQQSGPDTVYVKEKRIENNIISLFGHPDAFRLCVHYFGKEPAVSSDYNLFYTDSTSTITGTYGSSQAAYFQSLYDWKYLAVVTSNYNPHTVYDQHSMNYNPDFTDQVSGNFIPRNILIRDAGADWFTPGFLPDDLNGALRDASPAIGAIEFGIPALDAVIEIVGHGLNLCGQEDILFNLCNNGATVINSVQLNWSVNGVAQPPAVLSGLNLQSGSCVQLQAGTFNISATDVAFDYLIAASLASVNGVPDPVTYNNSDTAVLKKGLDGSYTLNQSGTFGGTNFISFEQLASYLNHYGVCGPVVVNVMNGPYYGRFVLEDISGVNAVNTITVNGLGQELSYPADDTHPLVFLQQTDYLTIDGLNLTVTGRKSRAKAIMLKRHCNYINIRNCTIQGHTFNGIGILGNETFGSSQDSYYYSDNCSYSTFENNMISGWSQGININLLDPGDIGKTTSPSYGNRYLNNTFRNFVWGLLLNNSDSVLVSGNDFSVPDSNLSSTRAIYYARYVRRSVFEKNRIHNMWDGVLAHGGNPVSCYAFWIRYNQCTIDSLNCISNNLIHDIRGSGDLYALYDYSSLNTRFYHNTISFDDSTASSTTQKCVGYYNFGSNNAYIYNNIFSVNRSGSGSNYAIYNQSGNFFSDFNGFHISGTNAYIGYSTANFATLASWQAIGRDLNSVAADPLFVNPSTWDYHPGQILLNDIGMQLNSIVADDYDGVARPAAPDPGAYEFMNPFTVQINGDTICSGDTAWLQSQISGGIPPYSYTWSPASAADTLPALAATQQGYYILTVTDAIGISASDTAYLLVLPLPPAAIIHPDTVCAGDLVTLSAAPGFSYLWSNGDTTQSITIQINAPSDYAVTLSNQFCTASDTAYIFSVQPPSVNISGPSLICEGDTAVLSLTAGFSGIWNTGDTAAAITITPAATSSYQVLISHAYCTLSDSFLITVNPLPQAVISGPAGLCAGEQAILTASSGGTLLWSTGDTTQQIIADPPASTLYWLSVTNQCGSASDSLLLIIKPLPEIQCPPDTVVAAGSLLTWQVQSNGSLSWSPCLNLSCCNCNNPEAEITADVTYVITSTLAGCQTSCEFHVTADANEVIYIPNVFSPDGDGMNDVLFVRSPAIDEMEFYIYDRWGEKVFVSDDIGRGWDGRFRGKNCEAGVYTYYLNARLYNGKKLERKGSVSLVR
jgi:gliding motility-associated-like protein